MVDESETMDDTSLDEEGFKAGGRNNEVSSGRTFFNGQSGGVDEGRTLVGQRVQEDDTDDGAGDIVMFNAPGLGEGPELLTPGTLLAAASTMNEEGGASTMTSPIGSNNSIPPKTNPTRNAAPARLSHLLPSLPPRGLAPPPGFGAAITPAINNAPSEQNYFGQIVPGSSALDTLQNSKLPLASNSGYAVGVPEQSHPPFAHHGTVGGALNSFGWSEALETKNPFANGPSEQAVPRTQNPPHGSDITAMDGAAYLGSSFLDSLWRSDGPRNQTKNPYITDM